jgi:MauM/NapG family ferredoxin protein
MTHAAYIAISLCLALMLAVFVSALVRRGILVALRMTAQTFFLLAFLFLLTQAVAPIEGYLALNGLIPVDLFMRLSPVLALSAMLAGRVVIAAMLLSVATLVTAAIAGRWFCGWVCPLGTTFDVTDKALFSKIERPSTRDPWLRSAKYLLLVAILASSVFGAQVAGWLDPMSIVTRSYAVVVLPAADRAAKAVLEKSAGSESVRAKAPALAASARKTEDTLKDLNILYDQNHYYYQFGAFALILVALVGVQAYQKRFWCRKLCPLGAMLAIAGKWRPLGVRLDDAKCIDCGKCRRICPVGAIQGKALSPEECTFCGSCVRPCPVDALSVRFGHAKSQAPAPGVLPGRRAFLAATAAGVASAPLLMVGGERQAAQARVIRPPGAQDEDRFLDACVRCGECMKACPTNALHPTGFEAGFAGLWTPRIVPVLGYCDYNCLSEDAKVGNFCSTVCPTGAIKKLTPQEHRTVPRGTAYFRTDKCIPYVERVNCGVCSEHCPIPGKAIRNEEVEVVDFYSKEKRTLLRPYVVNFHCIGCGQCENVCPLKGEKGIRVEPPRSAV